MASPRQATISPFPSTTGALGFSDQTNHKPPMVYLCMLETHIFRSRYKLTFYFIIFFGSGLTIPFFAMRHQLLKK